MMMPHFFVGSALASTSSKMDITAFHCAFQNVRLPNNGHVALRPAEHLKRRFTSDNSYQDYKTFMDEVLRRHDAKKIPANEIANSAAWYIPHYGVYNRGKPEKIRIVFGCTGVLIRFLQDRVVIMCGKAVPSI